ncbi:MAG: dephospho-CoA kinase [Lachnospiraceae bacterium]|nr:dephospho-CoA kinase [Lachnospiraceae bacterium]
MKFIGVTGGVGAGKSAILSYLAQKPYTKVMLADDIAHRLMEPGTDCYKEIVKCFAGEDIFGENTFSVNLSENENQESITVLASEILRKKKKGQEEVFPPFDSGKLAHVIFSNPKKREKLNAIVHPAVKEYVKQVYEKEQSKGELDYLILEAALLIEEHYDEICDELWYIYTREDVRRKRLKESRGYSNEKIDDILRSQLSEQEFRKGTQVVIDNNGDPEDTFLQIEKFLRR